LRQPATPSKCELAQATNLPIGFSNGSPNRGGTVAEFKAPATWPKELTKKWQTTVGDGVATPALAGGKLYVFTKENGKEVARCLDAMTGKELWLDKDAYEVSTGTGPASGYQGRRRCRDAE
jgi:outer membrane protein assembly factor BamB